MPEINNNMYAGGPAPTFGVRNTNTTNFSQPQTGSNPNAYANGDSYSVDNTSRSFDEAMAKLTGKNIFAEQPPQVQTTQNTQVAGTPQLPPGITQEELTWAMGIEEKFKAGYKPSQQEEQAYNALAAKMSAAKSNPQVATQAQAPVPQVTKEEVEWALGLEDKINNQKYQPNAQEKTAYDNIAVKLKAQMAAQQAGATQQTAPAQQTVQTQQVAPAVSPPSKEEVEWALALEQKFNTGYKPNAQETAAYKAIADKLMASQNQQKPAASTKPVTQDEVNWALAIENKVNTEKYQATPDETAKYNDIANRLQAQKSQAQGATPQQQADTKDWAAWSQPFTVPRTLFETTPRIIQVPASLRSAVPSLPTYSASNVGPSLSTQPAGNTQPVSKQEVDWALAFEDKVKKGGYTPSESDLYQYKNIYERLQATKGQATQPFPTQQTTPQQNTQAPQQTQPNGSSLGDRVKNAWTALTK